MSVDVILTLAAVVMIAGLVIYLLVPPDKPGAAGPFWMRHRVIEIGRLMFGAGLLSLLLAFGRKVLVD